MPKLFLIRHAIAEDRKVFQEKTHLSDDLRPLTKAGRQEMKTVSRRLIQLQKNIDIIFESPLLRSQETVDILIKHYPKAKRQTLLSLAPTYGAKKLFADLKNYQAQTIALVGHEPDLSRFLQYLLTGSVENSPYSIKKAGVACLKYPKELKFGQIKLSWLSTPKILTAD